MITRSSISEADAGNQLPKKPKPPERETADARRQTQISRDSIFLFDLRSSVSICGFFLFYFQPNLFLNWTQGFDDETYMFIHVNAKL